MSDETICFKECIHIWAFSKPAKGTSYFLNDSLYGELVNAAKFAADMVDDAIAFVQQAGAGGLGWKNLTTADGKLTDLGLIADHYNLIKATKFQGDDFFVRGTYSVSPDFKLAASQDASVQTLFETVLRCLQMTARGLRGGVTFRGLQAGEVAGRRVFGVVNARRGSLARTIDGKKVADKFHPDEKYSSKKWPLGKRVTNTYMPSLADDRLFLADDAKLLGAIHVDYTMIEAWRGIASSLLKLDASLSWTIVHEATHKFARTRDVNNAYTISECRQLHWHSALRNASHHERFVGLDWRKIRGRDSFKVFDVLREPS